jgi:hypothetical protein
VQESAPAPNEPVPPAEPERIAPDRALQAFDEKGNPYNLAVPLRGLNDIRIVQMPELVQLVRDLIGEIPELKRLPKALGHFVPMGRGKIRLDPRIFSDHISAAKTLAHEFGHLTDYLPQQTMARGNILGRIYSLRKFMGGTFGVARTKEKRLREELLQWTMYWKPYDPATNPPGFVRYRESAVELYADAISGIFMSPAEFKRVAPTFYQEFFRGLDTKPEVKQAFFELQQWLQQPAMTRLRDRAGRIDRMFGQAQAIFEQKWNERQLRYQGFRGWVSRLKQAVFDNFAPVRDRGKTSKAIQFLFDSHPLAANEHWRWLERMQRTVIEPMETAGFTMDELGQQLFYERVANERYDVSGRFAATLGIDSGGRSVIANPQGHTPQTARDGLMAARLENGIRRQMLLNAAVQKFHDEVLDVMRDAYRAGMLTDEQWTLVQRNRYNYATFTPLEYVDTYVPAGFFAQTGTLKDIQNPFVSTVLKVLQMQRAIQFQRIKTATVNLLATMFPGEIQRAEVRRGEGGRETPVPPRERGVSQIMLREKGKPAWYNVPKEIAVMFEHVDIPLLQSVLAILDVPFRKFFYPAFITYNPIFQLLRNPLRDLRRSYVNAPQAVGFWSLARQLPIIKQIGRNPVLDAVRNLVKEGTAEPLIAEMLDNLALTPGDATFNATAGRATTSFDRILQDHGLHPPDDQAWLKTLRFTKPIVRVLDRIAFAGRMNELLPKATVYAKLREEGWQPKDAAFYVRNYIGTPNYTRRGKHINVFNSAIPFINIWMKGWAADLELARRGFKRSANPDKPGKSAASWWMRWAMTSGVWTVLKVAAGLGLLGLGLKKLFDGIGQFDKTNYDIIPIGYTGTSDLNPEGKVAYLKVPKDPTDRVISGVLYNSLRSLGLAAAKTGALGSELQEANANADARVGVAFTKNMNVAASDVPGFNPVLKIANGWRQYAEGLNPVDDFRNSFILSDAEHLAGGWDGLKPMLAWTYGQSGLNSFVRYDPQWNTRLEMTIDNTPVLNGLVRISDYGYREQQMEGERLEDLAGAVARLQMPANAQQLNTEFYFLRGLGADDRTPEQQARYNELREWHGKVWKPAEQQLRDADAMGMTSEQKAGLRKAAEEESKAFVRQ